MVFAAGGSGSRKAANVAGAAAEYSGHCEGAPTEWLPSVELASPADAAQWWLPWRRQHIGKFDSSVPGSHEANGASRKRRTSEMEKFRLIQLSVCYTYFVLPHCLGSKSLLG
jgi:hypothetical protein